jgi:hypothetical protein
MPTFTAPGRPTKKRPNGLRHQTREDGSLQVDVHEAGAWNQQAPEQLSRLIHAARKRLARERPGAHPRLLAYAPAYQARGVLHWHVVFGWLSARERADVDRLIEIIGGMVEKYGFGHQFDGGQVFENAKHAASYIARYMTGDHQGLERVVASDHCPKRPIYVSRELTSKTGITMRFLRWRRWFWHEVGVTSMDYCVKCHRLWLAMTEGIAAGRLRRLRELIRLAHPPPIISARSTVRSAQLALTV